MGRTQNLHSIVLHTHDIGEADRFCILLTLERGRIAARAHGVRKIKSKMGGSILPMRELMITARDGSSGLHISDCKLLQDYNGTMPLASYIYATQCADVLLSMLEDDHPVPEIFHITQQYVQGCHTENINSALPFTIQLLCHLGLLPVQTNHSIYDHLENDEKIFLQESLNDNWTEACPPKNRVNKLNLLCAKIVEGHSKKPLKAAAVAMTI